MKKMAFYPEQREAAEQIIRKYKAGIPFAVLLAQMQSGKTGSYLFTGYEMIRQDMIDRVIVICGSAETSLREQAMKDQVDKFKSYLQELLSLKDNEGVTRLLGASIDVHFSNDLSQISCVQNRTLIIHEECHMAQSKGNKPYKEFYETNKLEGALLGDFSQLKSPHFNYILGVSATPFSEIVANHIATEGDGEDTETENDFVAEEKYIYQMPTGDGYLGVPDFYRNDSIKFTAQKIEAPYDHFFQVLKENRGKYLGKYCIVRTFESKLTHQVILDGCAKLGYDCIHSFGGEMGIQKILLNSPANPTVIHISGRCRMGQVINKTHLGMVYESSNNPNADTLLQGLVGRVCGYNTTTSIDVYVSSLSEEHIADYSKAWTGEGDVELLSKISKAMNLSGIRKVTLKAKDKDGVDIMPIHPIHIPGELLDIEGCPTDELGMWVHQCLSENPELIKCEDDAEEIKSKLLNSGKFHKAIRTNHEEDEIMLKAATRDHKRIRPGKLKAIQNCPKKFTLNEQPFILYRRKGGTDFYLGGWVLYRDVHEADEIDRPRPKVAPQCNYVQNDESTEGDVQTDVSPETDSSIPSGYSTSGYIGSKPSATQEQNQCEVYEIIPAPRMVCEVDTTEEFIGTVKYLVEKGLKSYRPLLMAGDPDPVHVHLKVNVFSKEEVEKIKKQLKAELGITLKVKGTPGRPSKATQEYRKMKEITW